MTQRRRRRERCAVCGLHVKLCLCAALPRLATATRVVVLIHPRETRRTSNTGRLAVACLENSELVTRPDPDVPLAHPLWLAGSAPAVLFPAADAEPLAEWRARVNAPVTLVALDGSWGQASRMRRRIPALRELPSVTLPDGPPSAYRLRNIDRRSRLCTLEAIARALGILEGDAIQAALERAFTMMVERTLWMRGQLDRAEVTGGIPDDIPRHFER